MENRKKVNYAVLRIAACIFIMACILPALAMEEERSSTGIILEENRIAGGDVTDTVNWKIVEDEREKQTLVIYGSGSMEDYTGQTQQPWAEYKQTINSLIVEDGVTRIGSYSMYGLNLKEVQIGKNVESIGKCAFAYGLGIESIRIPGNVKIIEENAFLFHCSLRTVWLEEGVEIVKAGSFGSQAAYGGEFFISSSVRTIESGAVHMAKEYRVDEDNPYYTAVDGVLYNKDMTSLVDYPKNKVSMEYRIPDSICTIEKEALQRIHETKKVYIPSSVQNMQNTFLFRDSSVEEVYVDDGVPLSCSATFYGCRQLVHVRMPENITINTMNDIVYGSCNSLESFKIPNGVKKIERIGDTVKSLHEVIYDAENAVIKDNLLFNADVTFELVIGESVDYLPDEFKWLSQQAEKIRFQKPNTFTVEPVAFASQGSPLNRMTGKIHIDEQGVLYMCKEEDKTAQIFYCMEVFPSLFIPAQIKCMDEEVYDVVSIGRDAFKRADSVQNIVFEKPEQIRQIEAYGFANCPSLEQINMENTEKAVKQLFTGAQGQIGYRAFYNTGLQMDEQENSEDNMPGRSQIVIEGESGTSDLILSVESEGKTMKWMAETDHTGAYNLLTGDTLTVLAAVGNKEAEENQRYRIYFQWEEEDCALSVAAGQQYSFDGQNVYCYETEDPHCLYVEFSPLIGKTLSIPVTAVYPSSSSKGGTVTVWPVSLTKADAEQKKGKILLSETGSICAVWKTKRDEFRLSQTEDKEGTITLQGTKEGIVLPDKNFRWKTVLMREEDEILSYGKDYIKYVKYKDTLILPEGVKWKEEVCSAVKEGKIRKSGNNLYADNILVCNLSLNGGQLNLSEAKLDWDDDLQTVILTYKVINSAKNAEMSTNTITTIFYAESFEIDISKFSVTETKAISNKMDAFVYYQHSGMINLTSDASKTINVKPGTIKLSKSTTTKPRYFGEKIDYDILLTNPGAASYYAENIEGWILEETLSPYIYLESEDIEKMFREEYGKHLVIEIRNIEYVEWKEVQGIYPNAVCWKNGYNSGMNSADNADGTLRIRLGDEGTQILVETGDTVYKNDSLKEALKEAGFAPGRWTEYSLCWMLNSEEECFELKAGETKQFHVYGQVKDTFRMLSKDWINSYPTDAALALKSTAEIKNTSGIVIQKISVSDSVIREAYIGKRAFIEEKELQNSFTAEDGDVITYTLEFSHYGEGIYEDLPIVDEMYGAQALLVSVSKNEDLGKEGLAVCHRNGEDWFVLTEGCYHNVVIGGSKGGENYIAALVTVEKVMEEESVELGEEKHEYKGLRTRIEWNWPKLPSGRYRARLSYEALVKQELSESNIYSLGNIVWANDRINSRIYGALWGGGSIIDFRKEILKSRGNSWRQDVADEDGYTLLNPGDQVTYRMTLRSKGNGKYDICGKDIADRLPENGEVFHWVKDNNVSITFESTHESTTITGMEQWSIEESWNNKSEEGQQYIIWSEDTKIEFQEADAKVYIYVTLQYPEHQGADSVWERYAHAVKGTMLENTFLVYQFPVNVLHHLNEPGQVLLQKGVYGTCYEKDNKYKMTQGRNYYNNIDNHNREIIYYVLLHNSGTKRWYLNDIYDYLPEGFHFRKFVNDADLNNGNQIYNITTKTEFQDNNFLEIKNLKEGEEDVQFRCATIQWKEESTGSIRFLIGEGTGEKAICYDKEREQYYLNCNEAILFGYVCDIGYAKDTKDVAVNTMFMHYEDYPKTGLLPMDDYPVRFYGMRNDIYADQNDGKSSILNGTDIRNQYNIIYGDVTDLWLQSDVSVTRGEIIPGITKYTESYTSAGNGQITEYVNAAGPYDHINWRVRLQNSGTLSMTDYMFEDVLPSSYVLCGTVRYELYDYLGDLIKSYELLNITERTEDTITIINNNSKKTISCNGEETKIDLADFATGTFSVSKTEQGKEILSIHFSDHTLSIPEGGYMDLYLSSYNPTNQYENTIYTNQAQLIPVEQDFEIAGQGSLVRDENGHPFGVKNSSPVTVSFGYATGSEKAVLENVDFDNKEVSTNEQNSYIVLSDLNNSFTYELTVTNDTDKPMEKLIFIDNLPEKGDVSPFDPNVERESQFAVCLKEDANIKIVITTEDGMYELDKGFYTTAYSNRSVFTEEDWQGESVWSNEIQDARTIRIVIRDMEGKAIPPSAKITVMFDCIISQDAEPGQIAWNSFGYHYKLKDIEQELEAMPMPVGVKIADIPKVEKYLEDINGNFYTAKEDTEFRFVVYKGDALVNETELKTEEQWTAFLKEQGVDYSIQSVIVKAGSTKSEKTLLDSTKWNHGQRYTIAELQDTAVYELKGMNGMESQTYTFLYDRNRDTVLKAVNIYKDWSLELLKFNEDETRCLEGAVFALYSPVDEGMRNSEREADYSEFEKQKIEERLEQDGQVWHLCEVGITDKEGRISFSDLKEDKYYLMEIEAPDGYKRLETGQIVYRKNAENGIVRLKITNKRGITLPGTGGMGTEMFVAVGTVLAIASCIMCHDTTKKRRNNKGENK